MNYFEPFPPKPALWQTKIHSAYLHIPFCIKKCAYCDFLSAPSSSLEREAYVELLLRELQIQRERDERPRAPLRTVYFGGGTPGLLQPAQVARLLRQLDRLWGLDGEVECTLETNPGLQQSQDFAGYLSAGVNRLSMGVQAWQDSLLRVLGRVHRVEDFVHATYAARAAGFQRMSCDLMYGLPGQTLRDVEESVDRVLELGYTHVSAYSLILEEGTAFHRRYSKGTEAKALPSEEAEREQHVRLRSKLEEAGLRAYEISNACLPGEESRHNLVYWEAKPYWGFGAGAHSYVDGWRRGSLWPLSRYREAVETGALEHLHPKEEWIDRREAMLEFFLLGFRMLTGVSLDAFRRRFRIELPAHLQRRLHSLESSGLITEHEAGIWALTPMGEDLANQVFGAFLDWENN